MCSASGETSSLRKVVPLLWLIVFDEFKQKQMWNSTSGSLSPAALLLCLGHRLQPGHWSTWRRRCWWLWDFPPRVCAVFMRLGKRSPTPEWGQTHGKSTSWGNISVGGSALHPSPVAFVQDGVMSWSPWWCPGRGVWVCHQQGGTGRLLSPSTE